MFKKVKRKATVTVSFEECKPMAELALFFIAKGWLVANKKWLLGDVLLAAAKLAHYHLKKEGALAEVTELEGYQILGGVSYD